jgi:hypothetical protein
MKVHELIEILSKVPNPEAAVCFSYDSRAAGGEINAVDVTLDDAEVWLRNESSDEREYQSSVENCLHGKTVELYFKDEE